MKKGNVEVDRWRDDASQYRIFIKSEVLIVPRQDILDLRDLITEGLGEEKESPKVLKVEVDSQKRDFTEVGGSVYIQPLTEGEKKNRDDQRDRATVAKENIAKKEKDDLRNRYQPTEGEGELEKIKCINGFSGHKFKDNKSPCSRCDQTTEEILSRLKPQQESKEECRYCMGNHQSATCNAMKEPSTGYVSDDSKKGITGRDFEEPSKKPSTRIGEISKEVESRLNEADISQQKGRGS